MENKEYYSEQIMQSIDTVVKNNLNKVKFDKTEICTIVQQDKEDKTKYLVTTDGGLTFYAYSNNEKTIYSKGSIVYVTIPQGNYEFKKIITDKYSNNNEEVQQYTKPFDNFVIRNTIIFSEITAFFSPTSIVGVNINNLYKYNFDYLGLEFTGLSSGISGGKYFIKIDFCKSNGDSLLSLEEKKLLTLSSEQITGNPYNLISGLKFYHLFPFEQFNKYLKNEDLDSIKIDLDTTGLTGDNINIFITPILYFGYNINGENLQNRELELYSANGEYNYKNQQLISFDWYKNKNYIYNSNTFGEYFQYLPLPENYMVYFLQYEVGYSKTGQDDIQESGTYWKTIQKRELKNYFPDSFLFVVSQYFDLDNSNTKFKVAIKNEEDFYIESNIITFNNLSKPQGVEGSYLAEDTLYFILDFGDDGIYNNYGIDNKILSGSTNDTHKITVDFKNNFNFLECNPKTVIWKIPKTGSMLLPPKKINPDTGRYYNEEEVAEGEYPFNPDWEIGAGEYQNYYIYKNTIDNDAHTIEFRNSDQFSYSKTNNLISCEIEYENVIYQGSFRLQYGSQGTSGSNYAFNIYPDSPGGLLFNDDTDSIIFTAKLEDSEGNEIAFNEDDITWYLDNSVVAEQGISYEIAKSDIDNNPNFAILIAQLQITDQTNLPINLKAYYPIARTNNSNYYIEGAGRIVYDFQGSNPSYNKTLYNLYDENGLVDGINWEIIYEDSDITNSEKQNYPSLDLEKKWVEPNVQEGETQGHYEKIGYRLKPTASLNNTLQGCAIKAYTEVNGVQTTQYVQPFIILQNTYAFPLLNAWDESTYVDPTEGIIMSQLIGAGTKNADNQYTGVLMGSLSKAGSAATTGIYGFQNGVLRYKLDENGAFYVGNNSQDNKCYISFNENISGRSNNNELIIKTKNFELDTDNLDISSSNKQIKIYNREDNIPILKTTLGFIKIDKNGNDVYGLDIWDGAFRLYPKFENDDPQTERNPKLWVEDKIIYLNGRITNEYNDGSPKHWMLMGQPEEDGSQTGEKGCAFRIYDTDITNTSSVFKIWTGYKNNNYDGMIISGYNKLRFSPDVVPSSGSSHRVFLEVNTEGGQLWGTWKSNILNSNTVFIGSNKVGSLYESSTGHFCIKSENSSNSIELAGSDVTISDGALCNAGNGFWLKNVQDFDGWRTKIGALNRLDVVTMTNSAFLPIAASSFITASNPIYKKNIVQYTNNNAIELINTLKFYNYEIKNEIEDIKVFKNDMTISENYQNDIVKIGIMTTEAPDIIVTEDQSGINLYSYVSLCAKAIQELSQRLEEK